MIGIMIGMKIFLMRKHRFHLKVDYGCGAYNQYTFNKRLTKILLKQLTELSQRDIYDEEEDIDW
jgi:hypothetical protein